MAALGVVMQRARIAQWDAHDAAACLLGCFPNGFRNLTGLAVAEADPSLLVPYDHECRKAKAFAAFHNLRHAIDVHELIDELAVAVVAVSSASFGIACHLCSVLLVNHLPSGIYSLAVTAGPLCHS
jgi:hypothetical protein